MAELTDSGYVLKTQNEYFEEQKDLYLDIDPNWNLDPSTPDGLKIAADAETFSNLDEIAARAYNSKDPSKATGTDLDIVSALTGTERDEGTASVVSISILGTNGTVILDGALIESTADGSQWAIDGPVTISGVTSATAACTESGAIEASIGTITTIVNAQSGWSSVTNSSIATLGTEPQTDAELRLERKNTVARASVNQIDSTFSAISALDDVRWVKIYENDKVSPADSNGLPLHSTAIVVDGGDNEDIAEAVYSKRNPGPIQHQLTNPVTVSVVSTITGNTKDIVFNRPEYVDINIVYNVIDDGSLPGDADDLIKEATISYADGVLLSSGSGFNQTGFNIGESVPASRLYTPVNQVIGQYGDSYVDSITVNGGSSVSISFEELARFTTANITVNIT